MKIYDCFSYWDEDLLLDLRLNILNDYVDYFVIVEGNKTWQNNPKKLQFDIEKFKKAEGMSVDSEAIYVQIIGGYDGAAEKINSATVTAINFSVDMKAQLPEIFSQAAFKIDVSDAIPSKSVAVRITFAPKVGK